VMPCLPSSRAAAPSLRMRLCLVAHFQRVDHPIWLVGHQSVPSHFGEG
jgi:hypothetical protein